jgi:hypothetical protein
MNIVDMIKEGLRIARTSKSLWLYGFFVGLGAMANSGGDGHTHGTPTAAHLVPHHFDGAMALLAIASLVLIAVGGFMYFVSEGALIEGVTRVRRGKPSSTGEGWRDGVAHWGVLFRITVIYLAVSAGSLLVLVAPFFLALKLSGTALAVVVAIPAVLVAVPWLGTLYIWREFASRIAVLENRDARDAIGKARLFLHGHLLLGLKLIVAAFIGRLIVVFVGAVGLVAAGGLGFVVLNALGMAHATVPVIVLGTMALLPIALILVAVSGTAQSSIWTIGYLTQDAK